jgi:hypothetical protein
MENEDAENNPLMSEKTQADRWDKYPYFNGIDRE